MDMKQPMEKKGSLSVELLTKFHAFDTETPMGWLKVIATEEEVHELTSFSELLAFLNQGKFRGCVFFTFNLQF